MTRVCGENGCVNHRVLDSDVKHLESDLIELKVQVHELDLLLREYNEALVENKQICENLSDELKALEKNVNEWIRGLGICLVGALIAAILPLL